MNLLCQKLLHRSDLPQNIQLLLVRQLNASLEALCFNRKLTATTLRVFREERPVEFDRQSSRLISCAPQGLFEFSDEEFLNLTALVKDGMWSHAVTSSVARMFMLRPELVRTVLRMTDPPPFLAVAALRQPVFPEGIRDVSMALRAISSKPNSWEVKDTYPMLRAKVSAVAALDAREIVFVGKQSVASMPELFHPGLSTVEDPVQLDRLFTFLKQQPKSKLLATSELLLLNLETSPHLSAGNKTDLEQLVKKLPKLPNQQLRQHLGIPVESDYPVGKDLLPLMDALDSTASWSVAMTLIEDGFNGSAEELKALVHAVLN